MSRPRNRGTGSSRRTFLKAAAGVTAGTALTRQPLLAQAARAARGASAASPLTTLHPPFLLTPDQALDWHRFKAACGPTYAGSAGWKRFTDAVLAELPRLGAVDLDFVDIPYDHYIVEDWPDRRTHAADSGIAVEKLVTDGTAVPVVASYGMTSGFTPTEGITARLRYYDPARPPSAGEIAGSILVFQTAPYPNPPYSNQFLDAYTMTDYAWRSPGTWHSLYTPPPTSVTTSYHTRWVWSQLGGFAGTAIKGGAAGMVVVYDVSPGLALGLTQRSVYTADGKAGLGTNYINCPTLTLDRVNGAKVIADAKAGKMATLTLIARFQRDTGRAFVAYLPGKHYGTPRDQQILLGTHTDAMSLIEENGAYGILGILGYFNRLPKSARERTLAMYFDCRHFMPGGENSWPQYDYYEMHHDRLRPIIATVGVEHMGGRQTVELGPDGNRYAYSPERPEDGGVITSLMDVHNNNIWLVETIARAATDNRWPRVDVKVGNVEPGVNGGFQGRVRSPMNKGREYTLPGIGLAGDWPGGWTQTFAQVDTEAGPRGFDEQYFVQQVAGLTQITGALMLVDPRVIDLGWGAIKSALVTLTDDALTTMTTTMTTTRTTPATGRDAGAKRTELVERYVTAFRQAEGGHLQQASATLGQLAATVAASVSTERQSAITTLIEDVRRKLT